MENQTILNTGATTEDSLRTVVNNNYSQKPVSLFTTGSIIDNRYQVISRINRNSGEADIYKVADLQDNDAVKALKLFHRRDAIKDEVVKRLLNQDSPYIADFSACGRVDGRTYLIMPFYGKGSLASFIEQGVTFTAEEIRTFILPSVLEGLKAIHDLGIIHKDLKPGNMMISDDESHIVLIDFGISSVADSSTMVVTQTGKSPFYSAPETATGLFWTGSDYYSLGISLYELYTGTTPYQNAGIDNIALYAQAQRIPFPDDFDAELKDLIDGLTYKDISNRNDPGNPNRRWEYKEVSAWLNGEKPPVPGQNMAEPSDDIIIPYSFKGRNYYSRKELVQALLNSWEDGKKEVFRGFLARHFELTDNKIGQLLCRTADLELSKTDQEDIDKDASFFKLMYELEPDIEPLIWKGEKFDSFTSYVRTLTNFLTTDFELLSSVKVLLDNNGFKSFLKNKPDFADYEKKLDRAGESINLYLKNIISTSAGKEGQEGNGTEKNLIENNITTDSLYESDSDKETADEDNDRIFALIFVNCILGTEMLIFDRHLFNSTAEFNEYYIKKYVGDSSKFNIFCHNNKEKIRKIRIVADSLNPGSGEKIFPWMSGRGNDGQEIFPVMVGDFFFRNITEAKSFYNYLKKYNLKLYGKFVTAYRDYVRKHYISSKDLEWQDLENIINKTGITINPRFNDTDKVSVGDCIKLGHYKDNNRESHMMEWIVLHVDETAGKALVLSKDIIGYSRFTRPYDLTSIVVTLFLAVTMLILCFVMFSMLFNGNGIALAFTICFLLGFYYLTVFISLPAEWRSSKIRKWLNSSFFNRVFSKSEQYYIRETALSSVPTLATPDDLKTTPKDPVFILSHDEFSYCLRTIRKAPGDIRDISFGIRKKRNDYVYWLRPTLQLNTPYIFMRGYADYDGQIRMPVVDMFECIVTRDVYRRTHGIRPALWITI